MTFYMGRTVFDKAKISSLGNLTLGDAEWDLGRGVRSRAAAAVRCSHPWIKLNPMGMELKFPDRRSFRPQQTGEFVRLG